MTPSEKLAFSGEQVICFLEEITKLPCPRCGEPNLSPTLVGTHLVIRCSEALSDYVACDPSGVNIIGICDFAQVISKVSIFKEPFNWEKKTGRATKTNIRTPRGRRKTT